MLLIHSLHNQDRSEGTSFILFTLQVGAIIGGSPGTGGSPLQRYIPKGAFTRRTHLVAPSGHHEGRRWQRSRPGQAVQNGSSTFPNFAQQFWITLCHEMKRIMVTPEASIHDLVPANLAKARGDAVPVISAKYTKVGESIRRNAPHEVR